MYLLINLTDLSTVMNGASFNPLIFMVRQDLGDKILPGCIYSKDRVDDMFIIIETTKERCTAIDEALQVITKSKLKRKLRTEIKTTIPNSDRWQWLEHSGLKARF